MNPPIEIRVRCGWNAEKQRVFLHLGDRARIALTTAQAETMAMELRLCVAAIADPEFVMPVRSGGQ